MLMNIPHDFRGKRDIKKGFGAFYQLKRRKIKNKITANCDGSALGLCPESTRFRSEPGHSLT
jgi:hypothetical protein